MFRKPCKLQWQETTYSRPIGKHFKFFLSMLDANPLQLKSNSLNAGYNRSHTSNPFANKALCGTVFKITVPYF